MLSERLCQYTCQVPTSVHASAACHANLCMPAGMPVAMSARPTLVTVFQLPAYSSCIVSMSNSLGMGRCTLLASAR